MDKKFTIIGAGAILWDIFPEDKKLGGAPANFAYHVYSLGHDGVIISRVGNDMLGKEIIKLLSGKKMNTSFIQIDEIYPTGTVEVVIDRNNQPDYINKEQVAWDFIEWQNSFISLLNKTDAICFGTIDQRNEVSRKTIINILKKAQKNTEIVYDVNLRQNYFNRKIIEESLKFATILKLNELELEIIKKLFKIDEKYNLEKSCHYLLQEYNLKLVCLTKGEEGSLLINKTSTFKGDIFPCKVVDRVGAGDAFTAAVIIQFLKGSSLEEISCRANNLASWVTSKEGGMPSYNDYNINQGAL